MFKIPLLGLWQKVKNLPTAKKIPPQKKNKKNVMDITLNPE